MTPEKATANLMAALKAWRETERAKNASASDLPCWQTSDAEDTTIEDWNLRNAIDDYFLEVPTETQGSLF